MDNSIVGIGTDSASMFPESTINSTMMKIESSRGEEPLVATLLHQAVNQEVMVP